MRISSATVLAALLTTLPATTSVAGSYREIENFAGTKATVYHDTAVMSKLSITLGGYDPGDETLMLIVKGIADDVVCRHEPILLKTAAGVVHRIDAEENGVPPTCGARIPADWVKSSFTIQIKQYHFALITKDASIRPKEAKIDTSDLDLSRIAKVSANSSGAATTAASAGAITEASPPDNSAAGQSCVDGVGGNVSSFRVQVPKAEWTDKILRPGMEMVPPAQLEMMGERAYVRPQVGFLILTVQFTNTENAPMALLKEDSHIPTFILQSSKGAKFRQFATDFGSGVRNSGGWLNPGIPAPVMVVFDVPRDSYQFEIYWSTIRGKNVNHKKAYDCAVPMDNKAEAVAGN